MRSAIAVIGAGLVLSLPLISEAAETYESLQKKSEPATVLKRILFPFVATCDREKDRFRQLFCEALNERLKAQHQNKVYRASFEPSADGPLLVQYSDKPKPAVDITIQGCLTCRQPMLPSKGGDITKGRFFLFKLPQEIAVRRNRQPGQSLYDLGELTMASYRAELPAGMTRQKFEAEVLPFLRLELLFRPEAGTELVGKRQKYGVIAFELVGHRVYDKCGGTIYGAAPESAGKIALDKHDLSCPQNQPKQVVAQVKLPSRLPQDQVRLLMDQLGQDIQACYQQHGVTGNVPADIVVAPSGKVKAAKVQGDLSGSPAGVCVERLIQAVQFPKFSGEEARLHWPLALRD